MTEWKQFLPRFPQPTLSWVCNSGLLIQQFYFQQSYDRIIMHLVKLLLGELLTEQHFRLIVLKLILHVPAVAFSHPVEKIEHPRFSNFCLIFSYGPY
ncbi:MAG: hypothetical protein MI674_04750 [Cytophagales bacterium]|nr:hypothetical protein [Cytophagales bacterium]